MPTFLKADGNYTIESGILIGSANMEYLYYVFIGLLPLCLCDSGNISLLVVVDEAENDSIITAVEKAIDIINNNNDTLPEYLLHVQYTTNKQVY